MTHRELYKIIAAVASKMVIQVSNLANEKIAIIQKALPNIKVSRDSVSVHDVTVTVPLDYNGPVGANESMLSLLTEIELIQLMRLLRRAETTIAEIIAEPTAAAVVDAKTLQAFLA